MPKIVGLTNYQKAEGKIEKCREWIEGRRHIRHLTQAQLGREIKVNQSCMAKKLGGTSELTLREFITIINSLDAEDDEILRMVKL